MDGKAEAVVAAFLSTPSCMKKRCRVEPAVSLACVVLVETTWPTEGEARQAISQLWSLDKINLSMLQNSIETVSIDRIENK